MTTPPPNDSAPQQPQPPQGYQPPQGGFPSAPGAVPPPQPQQPYGGYPAQPQQPMNPSDEKLWATLVHVGGIFFSFVPALVGYLVFKDRGPFVRAHSASALNFQITMAIAYAVGYILSIIGIGLLILAAVWVVNIVFSIIAALKANRGEWYTYPIAITFVR